MNIFLTGGSGFIGKNIIAALSCDHNILAPSSSELDLTDERAVADLFNANCIDVVIHSAVKPGHRNATDHSGQLYANTRMFFNIMRNAGNFGKMIFLGSGAVYDVRQSMEKVPENYFDTHVPADEHGFSKYIIAKHAEKYENIVKLRLFGIFGRFEDYAIRFISNAICKTLFDLPITLRQNRRIDYLYIDDLMPVLEHFIHNTARYSSYNITPDSSVDLLSIAEMVKVRSGKDHQIIVGCPGMGLEYSGDNSRLKAEVQGITFTPLVKAIDKLYCWYEKNMHLIDRERLLVDK